MVWRGETGGISEMGYLYRNSGDFGKGKYLLFVCFYLPPYFTGEFEFDSANPQDLISTCFDLYSHRDDFEIVLVTKLTDDNPNSKPASLFPSASLSSPFFLVKLPFTVFIYFFHSLTF